MVARLAAEQQALDRTLAEPGAFGESAALADALKRRAELERRIAEAEAEWFEAATELERLSEARKGGIADSRSAWTQAGECACRPARGQRPQRGQSGLI